MLLTIGKTLMASLNIDLFKIAREVDEFADEMWTIYSTEDVSIRFFAARKNPLS